ncbi:MAG: prolipoprotein diacylglyceryl transferase [Sedimentisphaerales bacterium]|nr:prolipoprotein diacylglyceryl transferase [Sedimentisphaerales bacterium]
MHPELFEVPIVHLVIRSYGMMMVIGFLAAVTVIRHLSRHFTSNPQHITNAALYSLIAGVVGARAFFVFHYFEEFRNNPLGVFEIWNGGLELLGGVLLAIVVIWLYIRHHRLPMRHYLDALAIGLVVALVFGRIGCFLNGCCYGKPTDLPWGVRFPYGSFSYRSQTQVDLARGRSSPYVTLPPDFFGYRDAQGEYVPDLKPWSELTPEQQTLITQGRYRGRPVHPTQLYSSAGAAMIGVVLLLFLRRSRRGDESGVYPFLGSPGATFSLMFILYGIGRFLIEFIRDDNPYEIASLTISQLLALGLVILGSALTVYFANAKPERLPILKSPGAPASRRSRVRT